MTRTGTEGAGLGLAITSDEPLPGLRPGPTAGDRRVRLERAGVGTLPAGTEGAERLFEQPGGHEAPPLTLDRLADGTLRLDVADRCRFDVAPAGDVVRWSAVAGQEPVLRRLLTGHVLTLCALVQGLEVLHASAVAVGEGDGEVVLAVAGPTHSGKSSLALWLGLGGARVLGDDTIALHVDPAGGPALVFSGAAPLRLRHAEVRHVGRGRLEQRGEVVDEDAGAVHVCLPRPARAVALDLVLFPALGSGEALRFTPLLQEPRRVLAATANLALRTPERLRTQFLAASAVAEHARLVAVDVPSEVGAEALAGEIATRACALAGR